MTVGVLHSLSGTMAISEISKEINATCSVLSRQIVIVEEDGASGPQIFAKKAHKLLDSDGVGTGFGC